MVTLMKSMLALNAQRMSAQKFPNLLCRSVSLKSVKPTVISESETSNERNERLKRPLSPFVHYQPQLTWLLSITHRGTGIILTTYTAGLVFASLKTGDVKGSIEMIQNLGIPSPVFFAVKAGLAFPFTFHVANGIRHLVWDMGQALTLKGVYSTGYAVLILSAVSAVGLAAL